MPTPASSTPSNPAIPINTRRSSSTDFIFDTMSAASELHRHSENKVPKDSAPNLGYSGTINTGSEEDLPRTDSKRIHEWLLEHANRKYHLKPSPRGSISCLNNQDYLPTEKNAILAGEAIPGMINNHVKTKVGSEAVRRAAWRKRKNPNCKTFNCPLCGAAITTKQNLTYHISAHIGKRDYACFKCEKAFTTPWVRNRHQSRCRVRREVPYI